MSTVLLALTLTACGGDADTRTETAGLENGETIDLTDRTFASTEVRGHELVDDTSVTLTFESDRLSASAGCNTFMGAASWDDGTLTVDEPLAGTMMACTPELQAQDDWLTAFLGSSPELAVEGSTLTLGDQASGMTLEEQ